MTTERRGLGFNFNSELKPCLMCGGAEQAPPPLGRAHADNCPFYWHTPGEPVIVLRLNQYQAVNLLRGLHQIWTSDVRVTNNGDWAGEIPQQLKMRLWEAGWQDAEANDGTHPAATDVP